MRTAFIFIQALSYAILIAGSLIGFEAQAVEYDPTNSGYLSSVKDERYELSEEIVIVAPIEDTRPSLHDRIFTEKLTDDFTERYENEFGRTETQQFQSVPSRFFDKEVKPGEYVSEEEYTDKQQKFGNYVARRLFEFHTDNYMKNTPSVRGVYAVKEKLSDMQVKTKSGYKARFRYSISANQVEMRVENPYDIETKIIFYRIEKLGSPDQETLSSLGYNFTKTIKFVTDYATEDHRFSMSGVKRLKANWSTSLTGSKSYIEDKIVLGLAWHD